MFFEWVAIDKMFFVGERFYEELKDTSPDFMIYDGNG